MKIIDKVNEKIAKGEPFFSFEYFPPRTPEVRAAVGKGPIQAATSSAHLPLLHSKAHARIRRAHLVHRSVRIGAYWHGHRHAQGVENLFERQERMVATGPVFCDITWGAGGTTADVTMDIAVKMQNEVGGGR